MTKLVRDLIPQIMEMNGQHANFRIADFSEYKTRLIDKLKEETQEFSEDPSQEELADILEVIESIKIAYGYTTQEIESVRQDKRQRRGGFEKHIILE